MTFDCPATKTDALAVLDDTPFVRGLIERAECIAWKSADDGHELEVISGRVTYRFDVRMPMPETAAQ